MDAIKIAALSASFALVEKVLFCGKSVHCGFNYSIKQFYDQYK